MDNRLERASFVLGSSILVFLASILVLNSALFVVHRPISPAGLPVALAAAVVFIFLSARKYFGKVYLPSVGIVTAAFLGLIVSCALVSGIFFDVSYDGQTYHQEAVVRLNNGWNPVHDPPLQGEHGLWINHYPKAPWICAAQFYRVTGSIEQAKSVNLLLIIASFFLALAAFLNFDPRRPKRALVFSLLLALNPVAVYQSLCFYVDGQLASLFLALIALSYFFYRRLDRPTMLVFAACTVLLFNIKFTGVVYGLVLAGGLAAWLFLKRSPGVFKLASLTLACLVVTLFFVGYNPYLTNVIRKGHPFYPLAGPKAKNIIIQQEPLNFRQAGRAKKLWISIFSRTENVSRSGTTAAKWPFGIGISELQALTTSDIRIGGFGPWFGGAMLLSIVIIISALAGIFAKPTNPAARGLLGMILVVAISVLVNPESWWARYAPQLWMIPVGASILGLSAPKKKMMTSLSKILVLVLALNILIVSIAYFTGQSIGTWRLNQQLNDLTDCLQPVEVSFKGFTANKLRFAERGIAYREEEDIPGSQSIRLYGSETRVLKCLSRHTGKPDRLTNEAISAN